MRWIGWMGALALASALPLPAATYEWTPGTDVVGGERYVRTRAEDTVLDLARRHGFGYDELRLANPSVDPWLPGEGTTVLLPGRHVLPDAPREGIVINLDELRLYYYPAAQGKAGPRQVITVPISIGREGQDTPLVTTTVVAKVENPTWYPPADIRREHEADGDPLPAAVPPGPDNPLGPHAMKLGIPGVLIHGTNKPYGIGMPVTHGCIRLYPEDIAALMPQVPRGTPVRMLRQPWKTGWRNGVLYFETSEAPSAEPGVDLARLEQVVAAALGQRAGYVIDWPAAESALRRPRGVPQPLWPLEPTGG